MTQSGWEESFLYVPKGVKAPERKNVAVSRCGYLSAENPRIDYILTWEAISAMTTGYLNDTTFLFFTKPGMYCWEQLQHYCEVQIEPSRFAIWGLYSPLVMLDCERRKRPEFFNGDGFYRLRAENRLLAFDTFVVTPVVAKFLLSVLPHPETLEQSHIMTFADAIGELSKTMPALEIYVHHRSLVMYDGVECPDFIGVGYDMPNEELTDLKPLNT